MGPRRLPLKRVSPVTLGVSGQTASYYLINDPDHWTQSIELTRQLFSNRDSLLGILILFPITICGFHTTGFGRMSYDCFAICKTVAELACERFAKSCTFFRQDTERHIRLLFKSCDCPCAFYDNYNFFSWKWFDNKILSLMWTRI